MIPVRFMSEEERARFMYQPDVKPTSEEIDDYPELCADAMVIPKQVIPATYKTYTTYKGV
uniref:Uncharacterized protein n=1 Tax=viral metagenome TaxID=1070528 RepID=A0A6M3LNQ0_9ZZZZ